MRTKKLYIIRGLPGAGKSTEASKIGCLVIEPQDQYATQDGKYLWKAEDTEIANQVAIDIVHTAMMSELDVAVAEIFIKLDDMKPYLRLAEKYEYEVEVRDLKISVDESVRRGTHSVPESEALQMQSEWEDYDDKKSNTNS